MPLLCYLHYQMIYDSSYGLTEIGRRHESSKTHMTQNLDFTRLVLMRCDVEHRYTVTPRPEKRSSPSPSIGCSRSAGPGRWPAHSLPTMRVGGKRRCLYKATHAGCAIHLQKLSLSSHAQCLSMTFQEYVKITSFTALIK